MVSSRERSLQSEKFVGLFFFGGMVDDGVLEFFMIIVSKQVEKDLFLRLHSTSSKLCIEIYVIHRLVDGDPSSTTIYVPVNT